MESDSKSTKLAVGESSCWIWTVSVFCIYSVALLQGWSHRLLETGENRNSQTGQSPNNLSGAPEEPTMHFRKKSSSIIYFTHRGNVSNICYAYRKPKRIPFIPHISFLLDVLETPESKATVSDSFRRTEHISISMYGCVCQYIDTCTHICGVKRL